MYPNYKTAVLKTTFLLRHGKSFVLPSTFSIRDDNDSINMHAHVFSVVQAFTLA